MSLIKPRPLTEAEVERMADQLAYGPLPWREHIDRPLLECGLLDWYDEAMYNLSAEPSEAAYSGPHSLYDRSNGGMVRGCWVPEEWARRDREDRRALAEAEALKAASRAMGYRDPIED